MKTRQKSRRKWYFACLSYVDAVTFKLTSCTDMEY